MIALATDDVETCSQKSHSHASGWCGATGGSRLLVWLSGKRSYLSSYSQCQSIHPRHCDIVPSMLLSIRSSLLAASFCISPILSPCLHQKLAQPASHHTKDLPENRVSSCRLQVLIMCSTWTIRWYAIGFFRHVGCWSSSFSGGHPSPDGMANTAVCRIPVCLGVLRSRGWCRQ